MLAFPVPVFLCGSFVVLAFTFGQSDIAFYASFPEVRPEWHQRVALAFHRTDETVEFSPVQQEFPGAGRVRVDVCRGGAQWCNMCAQQPCLALL